MLSQTGTYALRATLYLARNRGESISAAEIARELAVPANYLAKVLRELGRSGLLESTRGAKGGYRLTASPDEVSIADVVAPFEEMKVPRRCLMGGPCDLDNPCTAHMRRLEWIEAQRKILRETTVAELLTEDPFEAGRAAPLHA